MPKNKVTQLTCGILFSPSFAFLDNWGALTDKILYKNKYFSSEYFPKVMDRSFERILSNEQKGTEHQFRISLRNIIYTHTIESNFDKEFSDFCQRIIKFIVPEIIDTSDIITQRIGIVYNCEIHDKGLSAFTSKYFKPEFSTISDFRFSKKESTIDGEFWSKKKNFINKIFTVSNSDENNKGIVFDYQYHYNPSQAYINDKIEKVILQSKSILETEILVLGEDK